MRRLRTVALGGFAAALLALGASAAAAPAQPTTCVVTGADLSWGFKESFRAYIDGSIANGEWTTADGATYATPEFSWHDGAGSVDRAKPEGSVAFLGSVRFTGHGGVLDSTFGQPVIRFDPGGSATLLLDVTGPTMDGTVVDARAVPFVAIDLAGVDLAPVDGRIVVRDAGTRLTAEGFAAFPDYEAGTAFDAISFRLPVGDCDIAPAFPVASVLVPLAVGAGAALAAGVVASVVVIRRRGRR